MQVLISKSLESKEGNILFRRANEFTFLCSTLPMAASFQIKMNSNPSTVKKLRDDLEKEGCLDRYEMLQPPRPPVDKSLIDARIEQCHEYYEKNGNKVLVWCLGVCSSWSFKQ